MTKSISNFSRALCVLLLCTGLVFAGCTEEPLDNNQNTEQEGNQNGNDETTDLVTISIDEITPTTVTFKGKVNVSDADKEYSMVTIRYSEPEGFNALDENLPKVVCTSFDENNGFSIVLTGLKRNTTYKYCVIVKVRTEETYSETVMTFTTTDFLAPQGYTNLSTISTANCYVISTSGQYCFFVALGNQEALSMIDATKSVSVLWESFGNSRTPDVGDLIKSVSYNDGYIAFKTANSFKEGNAVIAAKDVSGNIIWSWHIWLTDEPQGQEYYNNAGTMMDRNLGATSATPGDVGALGLLYQWGRKDPFLGSSSIVNCTNAKSTITWPSSVLSDSSTGTIAYSIANPTTFIEENWENYEWYYPGSESINNILWTRSDKSKSIYDPCPPGWRVPDGGTNGVWSKALWSSTSIKHTYDTSNMGMNFSGKFGTASMIWYPGTACLDGEYGDLYNNGEDGMNGEYWAIPSDSAYDIFGSLLFTDTGRVYTDNGGRSAKGRPVRCVKEL